MFELKPQHEADYNGQGYCIFERLLPVTLLSDLRREADKGRTLARQVRGESAQRLQPIKKYSDVIDIKPFEALANLPGLERALEKLIGPLASYGVARDDKNRSTGVLYEPAAKAWCTEWHRDWRDNVPGLCYDTFDRLQNNKRYFNQVNCALYDDSCTWVVPFSHNRRDTDEEIRRFPTRPIQVVNTSQMSEVEAELAVRDYATSLPGAFQVHLHPGDFLLYRNAAWHLGAYMPHQRRSTIHDFISTPEYTELWNNPPVRLRPDGTRDISPLNPNQKRAMELGLV